MWAQNYVGSELKLYVTSGHCIKGEYEHQIFDYYCTKEKPNAFQIAVKLIPLL